MSGKKKLIIVLIVLAIVVIFVFVNLSKGESEIGVTVEEAIVGEVVEKVEGSGRVQPEVEVNISSYVSAKIIELGVEEGDFVEKGQFLVQLDKTKYKAAVDQQEAILKSAKANAQLSEARVIKAKNDLERTQKLYDANLNSKSEFERIRADYLVAKAQYESSLENVAQVKAQLEQARDDLAKTLITSPMSGTVTKLNAEIGEVVLGTGFSQGTVIMTIADLNRMEVLCEIDENDVVNVNLGDEADIEIDAFIDTVFTGRVTEIAHSAITTGRGTQEEVTNFEVKIAIVDKIKGIRPGMSATVEIKTEKKENVVKIPIQAVTARLPSEIKKKDDGSEEKKLLVTEEPVEVIFVVKDGVAELREVKTGISDDTHIEVISGVTEGEKVVTGSYKTLSKVLKDGDKVKIEEKPSLISLTE